MKMIPLTIPHDIKLLPNGKISKMCHKNISMKWLKAECDRINADPERFAKIRTVKGRPILFVNEVEEREENGSEIQ